MILASSPAASVRVSQMVNVNLQRLLVSAVTNTGASLRDEGHLSPRVTGVMPCMFSGPLVKMRARPATARTSSCTRVP